METCFGMYTCNNPVCDIDSVNKDDFKLIEMTPEEIVRDGRRVYIENFLPIAGIRMSFLIKILLVVLYRSTVYDFVEDENCDRKGLI